MDITLLCANIVIWHNNVSICVKLLLKGVRRASFLGLGAMSESRDVGITRQGTTKVSIEVIETASGKAR